MPFFDNRCYTVDAIQMLVAAGRRAVLFCIPSTTLRYQSRSLQPCYVQLNLLFKDTRHTTICISSTIYLPPYGRHYTYSFLIGCRLGSQGKHEWEPRQTNKQTNGKIQTSNRLWQLHGKFKSIASCYEEIKKNRLGGEKNEER